MKKTLTYQAETGLLLKNDQPAGTPGKHGYLVTRHEGKVVYVHRLAWFLVHGYWPHIVDHINGDKHDNRLANLREVTASENAQNKLVTGALPGAHFHKPSGRHKSAIQVDGRALHLGYFDSAEAASAAYLAAKRSQHHTWSRNAEVIAS